MNQSERTHLLLAICMFFFVLFSIFLCTITKERDNPYVHPRYRWFFYHDSIDIVLDHYVTVRGGPIINDYYIFPSPHYDDLENRFSDVKLRYLQKGTRFIYYKGSDTIYVQLPDGEERKLIREAITEKQFESFKKTN